MDRESKVAWLNSKTNKGRNVNDIISVSTDTHTLPAGQKSGVGDVGVVEFNM